MRVGLFAVGRMKAGPERELAERYLERFSRTAPQVGLDYAGLTEIAESRMRAAAERQREESAQLLLAAKDAALVLLDERGKNLGSDELARHIARMRDGGRKSMMLAIGGPDGHDPRLRETADLAIAFGAQTWPHQLVRVLVAEQLYRAVTILSGHPYHRA